jgi:nicotinamide-nucleotide amidase
MWQAAVGTDAFRTAVAAATSYSLQTLRLFGIPESEIAETLRVAEREGVPLERLEVTTCLKRAEVEVVTRYEPGAEEAYVRLRDLIRLRHPDTLFSEDGATVDEQVAALLRSSGLTLATAESCTGGLLAARITELPGSSDYFLGGFVVYANEAKASLADVPEELVERHGAVSAEVALALAEGARGRLAAAIGIGVTGVAGPGGGSAEKPVGLVWLSVAGAGAEPLTRSVHLPGGRADIRDRATTVAMHLLRRALCA